MTPRAVFFAIAAAALAGAVALDDAKQIHDFFAAPTLLKSLALIGAYAVALIIVLAVTATAIAICWDLGEPTKKTCPYCGHQEPESNDE